MIRKIKNFAKSNFPFLVYLRKHAAYFPWIMKSTNQIFEDIYRTNKWGNNDSVSGPGSTLHQTKAVRSHIPSLIRELNCTSLLDIPCGDFFWMATLELDIEYIGGDIVSELVIENQKKYGAGNRKFIHLDLIRNKLPKSDLILCRDCLVHLSYKDIIHALKNIKDSGSTYLLSTTFDERLRNENIPTGSWRPINLQLPPFNLPKPLMLIDEEHPDIINQKDKKLGLWKIDTLPEF